MLVENSGEVLRPSLSPSSAGDLFCHGVARPWLPGGPTVEPDAAAAVRDDARAADVGADARRAAKAYEAFRRYRDAGPHRSLLGCRSDSSGDGRGAGTGPSAPASGTASCGDAADEATLAAAAGGAGGQSSRPSGCSPSSTAANRGRRCCGSSPLRPDRRAGIAPLNSRSKPCGHSPARTWGDHRPPPPGRSWPGPGRSDGGRCPWRSSAGSSCSTPRPAVGPARRDVMAARGATAYALGRERRQAVRSLAVAVVVRAAPHRPAARLVRRVLAVRRGDGSASPASARGWPGACTGWVRWRCPWP